MDRVLEVDRGVARGADPGGGHRAAPRGAAARARPHAAALPAVVRVLDARRLDRHAGGRPLRDPPHPHRRLRRVGPRAHAARLVGEPAAARVGRRAEPRPHADRLRGHPRGDHRGLDAGAGRAALQGVGGACCSTHSKRARRRCARCRSRASTRRTAGCSTRARRRSRARRPTGRPCSCSASSRPTTSSAVDGPRPRALRRPRRADGRARRRGESEGAWRDAFLQAPYLRDTLVAAGILAETFETAITWDRFADSRRRRARGRRARRSAARAP